MSAVDARLNRSTVQGAEFPLRGVSTARGVAVVETAALFAIGPVADATAALFITGRGLRRTRSEGESPLLCAARRNSCKSLFVIRNFSSPGLFFAGVVGGGADAAVVLTAAGTAAILVLIAAGADVFAAELAFTALGCAVGAICCGAVTDITGGCSANPCWCASFCIWSYADTTTLSGGAGGGTVHLGAVNWP